MPLRASSRGPRWPALIALLAPLTLAACERLAPDLSSREATSATELARLAPHARRLRRLTLSGPGIDDGALAHVASLQALEVLVLVDCDAAGAAGLESLQRLRSLDELVLYGCEQLAGAALEPLAACAKLRTLRLHSKRVDVRTLEVLQRCASLRSLVLTGALDEGAAPALAALRAALPNCNVSAPQVPGP
jgi:hypothetical protein